MKLLSFSRQPDWLRGTTSPPFIGYRGCLPWR